MDATVEHYAKLLGLDSPWKVVRVKLNVEKLRVDIFVEHEETTGTCPECGSSCRVYDRSPGRMWRHLDTMQFETFLHCEPPRIECERHGVKTMPLPWSGKHSRFTQLFEAFAIKVILASRSLRDAGNLLGLSGLRSCRQNLRKSQKPSILQKARHPAFRSQTGSSP